MSEVTLSIEPNQKKRILKGCNIRVRKGDDGTCTKGILLLNNRQLKKYHKSPIGRVSIPFKHDDMKTNMNCHGGFLPLLAKSMFLPAVKAIAPAVVTGVAGGLLERAISGKGLEKPKIVLNKKGAAFKVKPLEDGKGLHLSPWKHTRPSGMGLYLSHYPHHGGRGIESKKDLKNFSDKQKNYVINLL